MNPDVEIDVNRHCPACGAEAREQARFCATCGRALEGSYFPTDALRSSYHQQESYEKNLKDNGEKKDERGEARVLGDTFSTERNSVAKMALALATYALVPYLGILFCPFAVLFGGFGLIKAYRFPTQGGRNASFASIVLGILILCLQVFLWWLLYLIPELNK